MGRVTCLQPLLLLLAAKGRERPLMPADRSVLEVRRSADAPGSQDATAASPRRSCPRDQLEAGGTLTWQRARPTAKPVTQSSWVFVRSG